MPTPDFSLERLMGLLEQTDTPESHRQHRQLSFNTVPDDKKGVSKWPDTLPTVTDSSPTPRADPDSSGANCRNCRETVGQKTDTFNLVPDDKNPVVSVVSVHSGQADTTPAPDLWTRAQLELSPILEREVYPLYLACKWGDFLVMLRRLATPTADPILETRQALEDRPHLLHAAQVHVLEVSRGNGEVLGRVEVPCSSLPPVCSRCHHWTPTRQGVGECGQSWTDTTAGTLCDVPGTRGQGFAFRSRTP